MKRARLSRDDLAELAANRPPRRVHRDAPDLPVHYEGFTAPTPCGVPVAAWAARTRRPDLVTCPECRRLRRVFLISAVPGPALPALAVLPALRVLARAYED